MIWLSRFTCHLSSPFNSLSRAFESGEEDGGIESIVGVVFVKEEISSSNLGGELRRQVWRVMVMGGRKYGSALG